MHKGLSRIILPHLIAVVVFLVVALIYCRPALQGQVLQQQDVMQWRGMAKDALDYKASHGHLPLWTKSLFSGMPAYQIAIEPNNPASPIFFYGIFTLFLAKPISFFLLACLCFYFLSQVLRVNPYIGIIGALTYAYATYNPIIVSVGHDTKMQTLALLPAFIGSLILVYERKYLWGAALTALFTSLMVGFNHMQIVYYGLLIAFFMTIGYLIQWIKRSETKHAVTALAIVIVAGIVGVLCNAANIFTTYEASKTTIRGGTELADKNASKTGLSQDYALNYSMYKSEPFVMMVPKMFGGSSARLEVPQEESKAIEVLQQNPQLGQQLQSFLSFYWGGIGGTSGPPYVGAIICFLGLIGFFVLDSKHKWWILAVSILAIVMSWGEYFEGFNAFLLKALPMYNKFRAPSMIIVIPTLLLNIMAVLTLQQIVSYDNKEELWQRYKKGLFLTAGIFVILFLLYFSFDYTSKGDKGLLQQVGSAQAEVQNYVRSFLDALKQDRKGLFFSSLIRSLLFIAATAAVLWYSIRKNAQNWVVFGVIGLLAFIDLMSIDTQYLNKDNYQDEAEYQNNFNPSQADQQIMQDKSYYRVLDLRQGVQTAFNGGALAAYYHNLVGGYHPAKLSIYQDLIEHQLYNFPNSMPAYDMLNTKYIIQTDQTGKEGVYTNPNALGAAWFVKAIRTEQTPQAVMDALTNFNPRDTAIIFSKDQSLATVAPTADTTASIQLVKNDNDEVTYRYSSAANRFAVFSEVFYDKGWKAFVDGKELPIVRTNYVLRGVSLPAGENKEVRFVFHPDSFYTGEKIAIAASIIVWLLLLAAIIQTYRSRTVKA